MEYESNRLEICKENLNKVWSVFSNLELQNEIETFLTPADRESVNRLAKIILSEAKDIALVKGKPIGLIPAGDPDFLRLEHDVGGIYTKMTPEEWKNISLATDRLSDQERLKYSATTKTSLSEGNILNIAPMPGRPDLVLVSYFGSSGSTALCDNRSTATYFRLVVPKMERGNNENLVNLLTNLDTRPEAPNSINNLRLFSYALRNASVALSPFSAIYFDGSITGFEHGSKTAKSLPKLYYFNFLSYREGSLNSDEYFVGRKTNNEAEPEKSFKFSSVPSEVPEDQKAENMINHVNNKSRTIRFRGGPNSIPLLKSLTRDHWIYKESKNKLINDYMKQNPKISSLG